MLGISRWPHRKLASLGQLEHNLLEHRARLRKHGAAQTGIIAWVWRLREIKVCACAHCEREARLLTAALVANRRPTS